MHSLTRDTPLLSIPRVLRMALLCCALVFSSLSSSAKEPATFLAEPLELWDAQSFEAALEAVDDIISELEKTTKNPEQLCEALSLKGKILTTLGRPVKAVSCYREAIEQNHNNNLLRGLAYAGLGEVYDAQKSPKMAEDNYGEAQRLLRRTNEINTQAFLFRKIGRLAADNSEVERAIENYENAYDLYIKSGEELKAAYAAEEIGILTMNSGFDKKAQKYFREGIRLYQKYGFVSSEIGLKERLAYLFERKGDLNNAINLLNEIALQAVKENDLTKASATYHRISVFHENIGDERSAISALENALDLEGSRSDKPRIEHLLHLANLYASKGEQTEALLTLHSAFKIAEKIKDNATMLEVSGEINNFYSKRGDFANAYKYLSKKDSLRSAMVAEVQNLHEIGKKPLAQENAALAQKSTWLGLEPTTFLIIVIALLLLAFMLLALRMMRTNRKVRDILKWKVYKRTKELVRANTDLNTYLYKSSHDLRSPLTTIKSLLKLMMKSEFDAEKRQEYFGMMETSTDLIDDILLSLTKAVDYRNVPVKVEEVNFADLTSDLFQNDFLNLEGFDLRWDIKTIHPFHSDAKFLKVILQKTIANAIAYRKGRANDYCKVTIITDRKGATLAIEDNGPGISPKVKDTIFDMFVKGTHKSKGAGLGLYLVKIATDKIKGQVSLETQENLGSKLLFQLPNLRILNQPPS